MNSYKASNPFVEYLKRWTGSFVLLPVIVLLILNGGDFIFIDYLNLLIHEGGHGIFSFFGKFIYTLGGTITQLTIPLLFCFYYYRTRKKFLLQIFLVLLGENLLNVSVYVSDARRQLLPLLGGNKVYHDWNYLLNKLGILDKDMFIGNVFFYLGVVVFFSALIVPVVVREYKNARIHLEL